MILKKCFMTNNPCYKGTSTASKVGIVVHSTGVPNKTLKRYVQPLKTDSNYAEVIADIGTNIYGNDWNHITREVGVHAFIGENAKGVVETYQVMPYEKNAWGVGKGSKGSYNYSPTAHIQFEICEDNLTDKDYFNRAMTEAIEYCAYLCKIYGWSADKIVSHAETHKKGYGSNHGDPDHWLKKFGKDMNWFRGEVDKILNPEAATVKPASQVLYKVQVGAYSIKENAEAMLASLKAAGFDGYIKKEVK